MKQAGHTNEEFVEERDDLVVPLPLGLDDGALILLSHDALAVQGDEVEELVDLVGNALEVDLEQFLGQELLFELFGELLDEVGIIAEISELDVDDLVVLPDELDEDVAADVVEDFTVLLEHGAFRDGLEDLDVESAGETHVGLFLHHLFELVHVVLL